MLWKGKKEGEDYWDAPFGDGTSWLAHRMFRDVGQISWNPIDIHAGGVDQIFPHHENEIAQSEAALGSPFVKYWLHSAHLIIEGEKMAKSKGNFYTVRDLIEEGYDPLRSALHVDVRSL